MLTQNNMIDYKRSFKLFVKKFVRILLDAFAFAGSLFVSAQRNPCFSINNPILLKSALELGRDIKSGKLSSERVVQAYIDQIKQVDKHINAVVEDHFSEALDRARKIDTALEAKRKGEQSPDGGGGGLADVNLDGPFVGVPLTIKETVALAGASYTAGVATRASRRASESNPAVDQLIRAGMIPLASTNTPCMCLWYDSYNLLHGRTNNPYDRSRIPGGSSGGEAALLASAGSVVGVGSDLAGSIRIPCNFCGIFGHKPTPYSVSNDHSFPSSGGEREFMRAIGPMTRYACDLGPMLDMMLIDQQARQKMRLEERVDLSKVKLFYCDDLDDPLSSKCEEDVINGLKAAIEHLVAKFDVKVEKLNLENFRYGIPMWAAAGADGTHYAPEHPDGFIRFNPLVELAKCAFGTSLFPLTAIVAFGLDGVGAKKGSAKQIYLSRKAAEMREEFNRKLGSNGILLMPTYPQAAPHHYLTLFKVLNCTYTAVVNTLHAPVTQCPVGMSREGLPIGLQLIATPYNDRLTLAMAEELERAFGGWIPPVKTTMATC